MQNFLAFGIGVTGGIFGSVVGLGGGVLTTPLLTGAGVLSQHASQGASLAGIVVTSCMSTWRYSSQGITDTEAAIKLSIAATPMSFAGAYVATRTSPLLLRR